MYLIGGELIKYMRQANNSKKKYYRIKMQQVSWIKVLRMCMMVTISLISIFILLRKNDAMFTEINEMNTILNKTAEEIYDHEEIRKETQELFIYDYVNRVKNINQILKEDNYNNLTSKDLKEIADFEDISNIYILNNEGIIEYSSDSNSIGIDFYKDPELDSFIPLIESEEEGYYCEFPDKFLTTDKNMVYLMVRNEEGKLIQIEIKPSAMKEYIDGSSISMYIQNMKTKFYRTVLLMDSNTGEVITMTKNNEQDLIGDNLLEKFKNAEDFPKFIKINYGLKLALTKEISDDLILVVLSDFRKIVTNCIINLIIISYIIFIFKLLLLNKNVDDKDASVKELSRIAKKLKSTEDRINDYGKQLKLSVSILGNNFTGYEYDRTSGNIIYADNFHELTGITECQLKKELKELCDKIKIFKGEKENITSRLESENGKIFRVNKYVTYDYIYSILEDITEKEQLKKTLSASQEELYIDELTRLYNRKKLEHIINKIKNKDTNSQGILLLMDLDNFKSVNDTKGHIEGDILLKKFADLLINSFRDSDYKVRLGGDEFIVFIPNFISEECLSKKMDKFLEMVREELREYYLENQLSVSIGVVYMRPECTDFEKLYSYADSAMYVAKRSGKDNYYINKEYNACIRKTCIKCKGICEKRKKLFESC